jgi:2-phospho-L-lactate guanylyltransferase
VIPAVVPVKALAASKSRLLPHLGREASMRLSLAMLGDVLEALLRVPGLAPVAVVTPDAEVAKAARAEGGQVLLRPHPGLNPAIDGAAAELATDPAEGVLVVLGDVAGAQPEDIELLLGALGGPAVHGVALAPSSDGGTSALLRVPADVIPARFGPASARAHCELAARAGVPCREMPLPSLALDIDEREDLDAFLRGGSGGTRTRALLDEIAWKPGP